MRTLSTNQSVNLNQPRIDQSIINGNKKEDKTKKNNSYGTIATVASYLTGATTGFLLAARVFSTLLLTSPALGTAGCLAIAALIGIASAAILAKGLLFLLNACRNYCNSCLPIKKSESYIDPGQNLSVKQKEEQYKEALKNVSNLLCTNDAFQASLLEAINPENIGNILEENPKEILAKGFVYTFLGPNPDETSENSKELLDLVKKSFEEADEETKNNLIYRANSALLGAKKSYRLVPQANDKQKCRIINMSAESISPEEAKGLLEYYGPQHPGVWNRFLDQTKATVPVREKFLNAYLEMHSGDPNVVVEDITALMNRYDAFQESVKTKLKNYIKPTRNQPQILELDLKEFFAEAYVSTFLGISPDEASENSKELVDVVKQYIEKADEETKTKLFKGANDWLEEAESFYRLVPSSGYQTIHLIDLGADTISPEGAKGLVKFYESRSLEGWYEFLDKAKATPAVRGEILKAYLATYSDDPNRVANEIKSLLDCNYTFRKSVAAKLETCVEPSGNQPQILELDLKEFFAEAYVHFFLGTKVNETSENSKELVDVAKKIIKEADEETKNNLIYRANSALLGAKKSYRLVPQASDKQKCRIIDLGTDTISPENAEGLVKFYKGLRLKEWYEFLNKAKATPAVREEIFKTYLATYSDDPNRVANDIERLLGYNCTFRKSVAAKIKAYTALPGDKKEISELDLKEFFAGAYVHAFLDSEIDETLEKSKELLDLAKKSFEKAAEEKKKNFIDCANDWLKIANSSYRVIPQASDKQECRIIDLSAKTISPEDAKGLVEFYGSQSPNDWHKFLRAATTAVREKILNAYLEMHSHEMLNEIEKFLGSDESFKNLFVYTTDARMNEARMKSLKNEEEISELNPVSIFAEVYVSTFLGISPDEASENSKELVDVVKKSFEEADEEGKKGLIKSANDVLKNAQLSYQLVLNSENQTIQIKTES